MLLQSAAWRKDGIRYAHNNTLQMDRSMLNPTAIATTLLLAAIVALGPLSTDMYLPALPRMTEQFGVGVDQMQLTLSLFLAGFAVAQLVYGPLADRFGRKPVLLGGLALFTLASAGCAFAASVEQLILFRFLQALGACAGPVLGRTMVRDIHGPEKAAQVLSLIGTIMAVAPAVAPILGGLLVVWFDWQSIFLCLSGYGLLTLLLFAARVPESMPPEYRSELHPRVILRNYGRLLRNRRYLGFTLCCSFVFAGLFSFISGSSFVLIDYFGVAEQQFGWFFALAVAGYMSGTQIAQRIGPRLGIQVMLARGVSLTAAAGCAMALPSLLDVHHLGWLMAMQCLFMVGVGIVMPQAMAGALAPFAQIAGTASALLGFTQAIISALVGVAVGHLYGDTPVVMTSAIGIMGTLALLAYALLVREAGRSISQTQGLS